LLLLVILVGQVSKHTTDVQRLGASVFDLGTRRKKKRVLCTHYFLSTHD